MQSIITAAVMAALLPAAAQGQAPGPSVTQPSPHQNQPQIEQNQGQRPPGGAPVDAGRSPGQSFTQPSPNQNQPQIEQNQGQGRVQQSR